MKPKITGIMPVHNVISGQYPFLECILLALPLVDEMIIYDGGSVDGTIDVIKKLEKADSRIKLVEVVFNPGKNWSCIDENFEYCMNNIATGDWIIPFHADEYFHPDYHNQILDSIYKYHNTEINSIRHNMFCISRWQQLDSYNWLPVRIFRKQHGIKALDGIDSFKYEKDEYNPMKTGVFVRSNLYPEVKEEFVSYHINDIFEKGEFITDRRHVQFYGIDSDFSRLDLYLKKKELYGIDKDDEDYNIDEIKFNPITTNKVYPSVPDIFHGLIGRLEYETRDHLITHIQKYKKLK